MISKISRTLKASLIGRKTGPLKAVALMTSLFFSLAGNQVFSAETKMHVIAHRGGRKWAPENTMSAFRKSLVLGVYGIELDIHRCKTGELVVIHDEDVERTTDGKGFIADKSWDELSKLSAGKWYAPEFADERLPLLKDVLALIDGKAVLNIEIKNGFVTYPGIENDLLALLEKYPYPDKIVISSFDHQCLLNIHKKTDKYKLAVLIDGLLVDLDPYCKKLGAKAWNPGFSNIAPESVKAAHDAGLEVNSWTVNGDENFRRANIMHLDSIITDDPEAAMKYFAP